MMDERALTEKEQTALQKIGRATRNSARISAKMLKYGSAIGALVAVGTGVLPPVIINFPELIPVFGIIGGDMLAGIIDDVANNDQLSEIEIIKRIEAAIDNTQLVQHIDKQAARSARRDQAQYEHIVTLLESLHDQMDGNLLAQIRQPIPLNFPPRADHFIGRQTYLTQLENWLHPGRTITLHAPGGYGKTALSWKALQRLHDDGALLTRFPDGVLFYTFYGQPSMETACVELAKQVVAQERWETAIDPRQAQATLRHAISGKHALIILDGAEAAADLRTILDVRDNCGVLISTRKEIDGRASNHRINVDTLSRTDAIALLQTWMGEKSERGDGDREVLDQICEQVGDTPFSVQIAGRYMRESGDSAAEYLAWLEENPIGATNPDDVNDRHWNAERLIARSVEQVGEDAQTILAIAGAVAFRPFSDALLVGTLGESWDMTRRKRATKAAQNYGLLKRTENGSWELTHALVYAFVRRVRMDAIYHDSTGEPLLLDVLVVVSAYYIKFAERESNLGLVGYNTLDRERVHIMAVLSHLNSLKQWEFINLLVWVIHKYMEVRGYWAEQVRVLEWGIKATRNINLKSDEAKHRVHLANTLSLMGRASDAIKHYKQSFRIFRRTGDHIYEAGALGGLGLAYVALGRIDEAIEMYEKALSITREFGDRQDEAKWIANLGIAYAALGRVDEAIEIYEQALVINREFEDRLAEASNLCNLGLVYVGIGRAKEAIEMYEEALIINREFGDRFLESAVLGNLGVAYAALDRSKEAIEMYEQAMIISREIGNRHSEGRLLGNIGGAYQNLNQLDKATIYHRESLAISREIDDRQGEGEQLANIGLIHRKHEQLVDAKIYWEESLAILTAIKSPQSEWVCDQLDDLNNQ